MNNVCWDCIKGRHVICKGYDDDGPCYCPVPHTTSCARKPVYDHLRDFYVDPGPQACLDGTADTDLGCSFHGEEEI
jgi:hypothetical protein